MEEAKLSDAIFTRVLSRVAQLHNIEHIKPLQHICLKYLIHRRDVLACLPTGFGKSFIYQAWPTVCSLLSEDFPDTEIWTKNPIVVVVSPLVSIMEEQVKLLTERGIPAAYAGHDPVTDEAIAKGQVSIVYGSPEMLVGNAKWRNILQDEAFRRRLVGLVVDEVHTVVQWGEGKDSAGPFRKWCGLVGELRGILPTVPVLALTATASLKTRKQIKQLLEMEGCIEITQNPDRPNVRLAIKKVPLDISETFAWLCKDISAKGICTEKVVIYCRSLSDCGKLYNEVFKVHLGEQILHPPGASDLPGHRLVDMFHSGTNEEIKRDIINSLNNPFSVLRVVIATSALGMGVDFKQVNYVVNYGPPKNLEAYMQALGRGGRDGEEAHSIILYNGRQMIGVSKQMRQYMSNKTSCRRVKLLELFDGLGVKPVSPAHACCDICASSCNCSLFCDGNASRIELYAGEPVVLRQRGVSDSQRHEILIRMEDKRSHFIQSGLKKELPVYCTTTVTTDSSQKIIDEVMTKSPFLFTLGDILWHVPISTLGDAQVIFDVLSEVFEDSDWEEDDEPSFELRAFDRLSLTHSRS